MAKKILSAWEQYVAFSQKHVYWKFHNEERVWNDEKGEWEYPEDRFYWQIEGDKYARQEKGWQFVENKSKFNEIKEQDYSFTIERYPLELNGVYDKDENGSDIEDINEEMGLDYTNKEEKEPATLDFTKKFDYFVKNIDKTSDIPIPYNILYKVLERKGISYARN